MAHSAAATTTTTTAFIPDAWTRARDRFVEDLTEEERHLYAKATPETVLYEASALEKTKARASKTRGVLEKVQPFVESVEGYGRAIDVFANTYPLVMRYDSVLFWFDLLRDCSPVS